LDEKDLEIQSLRQRIARMDKETAQLRALVPVMPGDTIFVIVPKRKPVVVAWRVIAIEIDEWGRSALKCGWYQDRYQAVEARRQGETWFTSREAAEAALEERGC